MKQIMLQVHRNSKRILIIGSVIVAAVLISSTVLYIGAGRFFDYYSATEISEKLLTSVRPLSLAVSAGSIGSEYYIRHKNQ